jgi:hypothetical protein
MPTWNEAEKKIKPSGFKKSSYRPSNSLDDSSLDNSPSTPTLKTIKNSEPSSTHLPSLETKGNKEIGYLNDTINQLRANENIFVKKIKRLESDLKNQLHGIGKSKDLRKKVSDLEREISMMQGTKAPTLTEKLTDEMRSTRLKYCSAPTRNGIELIQDLSDGKKNVWVPIPNSAFNRVMEAKYIKSLRKEGVDLGLLKFKQDKIPDSNRIGFFYKLT